MPQIIHQSFYQVFWHIIPYVTILKEEVMPWELVYYSVGILWIKSNFVLDKASFPSIWTHMSSTTTLISHFHIKWMNFKKKGDNDFFNERMKVSNWMKIALKHIPVHGYVIQIFKNKLINWRSRVLTKFKLKSLEFFL